MLAGVEAEDRAHVGVERGQQLEPVLFGGGESPLVRQDSPGAELLQPDAHDETVAPEKTPLDLEELRVQINSGPGSALEHAFAEPFAERTRRRRVAIRIAIEFQTDDIVEAARVEGVLARSVNQVIRRRHQVA